MRRPGWLRVHAQEVWGNRGWRIGLMAVLPLFVMLAAPGWWQACLGLALALAAAWMLRRHRRVRDWEHELDVAFAPGDRREIPEHRSL